MTAFTVSFLGLGVMGYPMAGHLMKAGHAVTVYNRTASKAEAWVKQHGGRSAATPAEAARDADFVMACVGNDDDLRAVTIGERGAFAGMKRGAVFCDHTTASAEVARELFAAAKGKGFDFLDCPVSGGQAGAEKGILTIMCGGETAAFARAEPVMRAYGKAVNLMGETGAGQLTKMVNQICFVGVVQSLAEGLVFAERSGLDPQKVVEVISKGAAQSWQMENRGPTMIADKFDFGFAVDWARKDLGICLAEARRNGTPLPQTAMIDQFYAAIQRRGGGRWDTSSLIKLIRYPEGQQG